MEEQKEKKYLIAQSCTEAEFKAMAQGVYELLWPKIALQDKKKKSSL